jgi:hypothetical protein
MRMAVLLIAGLIASIESRPVQAPLFVHAPGSPIAVGKGSGTILFADLNGDRHLDLMSRHLLERVLIVRLGDGRGGFGAATTAVRFDYDFGGMALGDMNEDGLPDVAVTSGTRDFVDLFIGIGKGEFRRAAGSPFTVTDASEPFNKRTIHTLDLNEDGHLDVVTANGRRRNTFAVLFGTGHGTFTRGPEVPLDSGRDGYVFAFADFNGDGHLDVVSASRSGYDDTAPGRVIVRFGDGKGNFMQAPASPFDTLVGPRSITIEDFNGDRRPDVAITNRDGLLSLFMNDGRGALTAADGTPFGLGVDGHSVAAADVNRDGRMDLICANVKEVAVFLGGRGTFAPAPGSPYTAGPGSYFVTLVDLNRDGKLDIAASAFEGDGITLLLQR